MSPFLPILCNLNTCGYSSSNNDNNNCFSACSDAAVYYDESASNNKAGGGATITRPKTKDTDEEFVDDKGRDDPLTGSAISMVQVGTSSTTYGGC